MRMKELRDRVEKMEAEKGRGEDRPKKVGAVSRRRYLSPTAVGSYRLSIIIELISLRISFIDGMVACTTLF